MYNTLEEIRNTLSVKELNKYGDEAEGKTAEEIIEMLKKYNIEISLEAAREAVEFLRDFNDVEVQDHELVDVAGGTCYSDGVICPLDGAYKGQWKRYVIVSPLNICPASSLKCRECPAHFEDGGTWYCSNRWKGHDTLNDGRDPNVTTQFIDD